MCLVLACSLVFDLFCACLLLLLIVVFAVYGWCFVLGFVGCRFVWLELLFSLLVLALATLVCFLCWTDCAVGAAGWGVFVWLWVTECGVGCCSGWWVAVGFGVLLCGCCRFNGLLWVCLIWFCGVASNLVFWFSLLLGLVGDFLVDGGFALADGGCLVVGCALVFVVRLFCAEDWFLVVGVADCLLWLIVLFYFLIFICCFVMLGLLGAIAGCVL